MEDDKIQQAISMARAFGLSPAQVRVAANQLERTAPTLREVLAAHPLERSAIAARYPQGLAAMLDGRGSSDGSRDLTGLGHRPYTDLTVAVCRQFVRRYQELVAAGAQLGPGLRRVGRGPRTGASAAAQLVHAMRATDRLLAELGLRAGTQLDGLGVPARPGPTREKSLTPREVVDFAAAVLLGRSDPILDLVVWLLFRTLGARPVELERLRPEDVNLARGSVTLVGKSGPRREMPVHRPVLELAVGSMAARPAAPTRAWLRGLDGHPLTGRRFDKWSERLHEHAPWAAGHAISVYALRHTAAQSIYDAGGDLGAVALWLGQTLPRDVRIPGIYGLVGTPRNRWELRRQLAETVWGPLDGWPRLSEGAILTPTLDVALAGLPDGLVALPGSWRRHGVR